MTSRARRASRSEAARRAYLQWRVANKGTAREKAGGKFVPISRGYSPTWEKTLVDQSDRPNPAYEPGAPWLEFGGPKEVHPNPLAGPEAKNTLHARA